ncbi:MAG: peptide chain release factor N(5)-glutamine methyltransferase [Solitalea sp.]
MQKLPIGNADIRESARAMCRALEALYEPREAEALTWIVLEHLTGLRRSQLTAGQTAALSSRQREGLRDTLEQLLAGKPLQYILGTTSFYGLTLQVNPSVLIPRQETEELVHWILHSDLPPSPAILDIGTGSGCIAIALKKNRPGGREAATVWACDVSAEALDVASENARTNDVDITFKSADILNERSWEEFPLFDVIVSNPPYVTQAEQELMHRNVLEHEPHLALFAPDEAPLLFYSRITAFARQKLRAGGRLYFEINEAFGPPVLDLLQQAGFRQAELRKDLNGRDRMVRALQVHPL